MIPGPVERVAMNNPHALDNLLPGSTVDTFILEVYNIGLCTLLYINQFFHLNEVDHYFHADFR